MEKLVHGEGNPAFSGYRIQHVATHGMGGFAQRAMHQGQEDFGSGELLEDGYSNHLYHVRRPGIAMSAHMSDVCDLFIMVFTNQHLQQLGGSQEDALNVQATHASEELHKTLEEENTAVGLFVSEFFSHDVCPYFREMHCWVLPSEVAI